MDVLAECLSEDEQAWSPRQAMHQTDSAPSKPVDWGYRVALADEEGHCLDHKGTRPSALGMSDPIKDQLTVAPFELKTTNNTRLKVNIPETWS